MSTPLLHSLPGAVVASGISRSGLYEHHNAGRLRFVKVGRRTYIAHEELERFVKQLVADAEALMHKSAQPTSAGSVPLETRIEPVLQGHQIEEKPSTWPPGAFTSNGVDGKLLVEAEVDSHARRQRRVRKQACDGTIGGRK